ncbi:MAG TPA: bifunctional UDP-N-acetylglucosamine diphosphorylase/glucosamine-1-phosphate N-acetyltransferase GlmU [Methylomirabilota bacterium]|nr:bifunctional UDP-N-acetylglucosamine diphosphorylase/glucosamine-1-phosphate N-acetyltransferase GlmU [Methylomirabilota bacterium]
MNGVTTLILAAGEGKRMRSRMPKVLHMLCGRPLISYPLRLARTLGDRVVMVVGPNAEGVQSIAGGDVAVVEQRERLGTGHAVLQARTACPDSGTLLVVAADMPLLLLDTLERLVEHHRASRAAATVLTAVVERPQGYGRVLRQGGRVKCIVEDRDATDDERKIGEINTSVYCFEAARLWSALGELRPDNDQGELYLTDVIGVLVRAGARVEAVGVADPVEAMGVNDRKQLATLAAIQRGRILDRLMAEGVTVLDPASTYVDDTVAIGPDTTLYPNVQIEGATTIGSDCVIGSGCHIVASRLADGVRLRPYCVLTDAEVEEAAELGPFAHLRPRAVIGARAKVGNFVEIKKSRLGRGSKAPHLSYIGDATVGDGVNIGAGAITCNYDGFVKHETTIRDGAFVGTNVSLVAPVTIGEGAYIGSGSVITKDVPADALAVERSQQIAKEGWAARKRAQHGAKKEH